MYACIYYCFKTISECNGNTLDAGKNAVSNTWNNLSVSNTFSLATGNDAATNTYELFGCIQYLCAECNKITGNTLNGIPKTKKATLPILQQ